MGNKSSNMSSSQQSNKRYKYEEAKRNKRLEANRKSAAASRQRRLHLIDDLKDTIERMSQKIEGLQKENTELRMKLAMPIANYGVTGFQSTVYWYHFGTSSNFNESRIHTVRKQTTYSTNFNHGST